MRRDSRERSLKVPRKCRRGAGPVPVEDLLEMKGDRVASVLFDDEQEAIARRVEVSANSVLDHAGTELADKLIGNRRQLTIGFGRERNCALCLHVDFANVSFEDNVVNRSRRLEVHFERAARKAGAQPRNWSLSENEGSNVGANLGLEDNAGCGAATAHRRSP